MIHRADKTSVPLRVVSADDPREKVIKCYERRAADDPDSGRRCMYTISTRLWPSTVTLRDDIQACSSLLSMKHTISLRHITCGVQALNSESWEAGCLPFFSVCTPSATCVHPPLDVCHRLTDPSVFVKQQKSSHIICHWYPR